MDKTMTALIIMDGFGINPAHEGNAIYQQGTPHLDALKAKYPSLPGGLGKDMRSRPLFCPHPPFFRRRMGAKFVIYGSSEVTVMPWA